MRAGAKSKVYLNDPPPATVATLNLSHAPEMTNFTQSDRLAERAPSWEGQAVSVSLRSPVSRRAYLEAPSVGFPQDLPCSFELSPQRPRSESKPVSSHPPVGTRWGPRGLCPGTCLGGFLQG